MRRSPWSETIDRQIRPLRRKLQNFSPLCKNTSSKVFDRPVNPLLNATTRCVRCEVRNPDALALPQELTMLREERNRKVRCADGHILPTISERNPDDLQPPLSRPQFTSHQVMDVQVMDVQAVVTRGEHRDNSEGHRLAVPAEVEPGELRSNMGLPQRG
jgi:hypothetical protein